MSGMTDKLLLPLGYHAEETNLRTVPTALAAYGPASFSPTIKCPGSLIFVNFVCTFQADGNVALPCAVYGAVYIDGVIGPAPYPKEQVQAANVSGQEWNITAMIQPAVGNHTISIYLARTNAGGFLYISPAGEGAGLTIIGAST